ncbi:MAG: cation-transporting P-type ATPase, partial [Candidatus Bipolaricaulia bacterium]
MGKGAERYGEEVSDVKEELDTSLEDGLTEEEAKNRRDEFGLNRIETEETPSWFAFFWDHLTEFVSLLLIVVALISLSTYLFLEPAIERLAESVIVFSIVLINASVGAFQEYRSSKTAKQMQEMMKTEALVVRGG